MSLLKLSHRKKAQVLLEFALVFVFLLIIILGGIIDFGFAFYNLLSLQQLANDTAQWAAESNSNQGQSEAEIRQFALSRKPTWWSGNFEVTQVSRLKTSDGADVIQLGLRYSTVLYTPFYQLLSGVATGKTHIPLNVMASYQIPQKVFSR